jgi:hypothetical protein
MTSRRCLWSTSFVSDFATGHIDWGVASQFPISVFHRSSALFRVILLTVLASCIPGHITMAWCLISSSWTYKKLPFRLLCSFSVPCKFSSVTCASTANFICGDVEVLGKKTVSLNHIDTIIATINGVWIRNQIHRALIHTIRNYK